MKKYVEIYQLFIGKHKRKFRYLFLFIPIFIGLISLGLGYLTIRLIAIDVVSGVGITYNQPIDTIACSYFVLLIIPIGGGATLLTLTYIELKRLIRNRKIS